MAMGYLFLRKKKEVLESTELYSDAQHARRAFFETFPAIFMYLTANTIEKIRIPYKK